MLRLAKPPAVGPAAFGVAYEGLSLPTLCQKEVKDWAPDIVHVVANRRIRLIAYW